MILDETRKNLHPKYSIISFLKNSKLYFTSNTQFPDIVSNHTKKKSDFHCKTHRNSFKTSEIFNGKPIHVYKFNPR